ncbi:unnamed protein product, partial [marine sediment metagenome]
MPRSRRRASLLRVGTDCSGIEAPIQALQNLRVPFRHVFSSETDKSCIATIRANYSPDIIFGETDGPFPEGDIRKRRVESVPEVDLYVCGFPCQPFSIRGARKGLRDLRGDVFESGCLPVIRAKKPRLFILENVAGLMSTNGGSDWRRLKRLLGTLCDYHLWWGILNTKDFGLPQNRPRLYIVGSRAGPLELPPPRSERWLDLSKIVNQRATEKDECCASHRQRLEAAASHGAIFANLGNGSA